MIKKNTNATTSHSDKNEIQSVSEEQILEQKFNGLFLEVKRDPKEEHLNCQEECNTLTEKIIFDLMQMKISGITP